MRKVVVIGGGIAGLSVSIELLQSGYEVSLLEKNESLGGLCSGYFVDGYYVDACLHWLLGTKKGNQLYKLWTNVGAFSSDTKMISLPTFGSFEYEGTTITFYRNLKKSEEEWIKISPIDKRAIKNFFALVKDIGSVINQSMSNKAKSILSIVATLPHSAQILKSMKQSREDYAKKFKHPAIRFAIENALTGYSNMFFFFDAYGLFTKGNADIPEGGALEMVNRMKNKFISLGGKLFTKTTVKKIVVEEGKVKEVQTNIGPFLPDVVVSAVDPNYTVNTLLKNEYRLRLYDYLNKNIKKHTTSSCYNLYVTVEDELKDFDVPTGIHIDPLKVGKNKTEFLLLRPYTFDECFKKDNKTVLSIFVNQNEDDYYYFKRMAKDKYVKETQRINENIIEILETKYPELKGKIKYLTHFGPIELHNRTNTSYGAIQSYSFTKKGFFYHHNGRIQGISNLYLCSQWNRSIGGTPTALLSAHEIAKKIDKTNLD